jgi:hypothetical protein
MTNRLPALAAALLLAVGPATETLATPFSGALALKSAAPSNVETVRWGGGGWGGGGWGGGWRGGGWGGGWRGGGWGWRGPGWGWGVGAGFVGGAIIGAGVSCWHWIPTAWGWSRVWVC